MITRGFSCTPEEWVAPRSHPLRWPAIKRVSRRTRSNVCAVSDAIRQAFHRTTLGVALPYDGALDAQVCAVLVRVVRAWSLDPAPRRPSGADDRRPRAARARARARAPRVRSRGHLRRRERSAVAARSRGRRLNVAAAERRAYRASSSPRTSQTSRRRSSTRTAASASRTSTSTCAQTTTTPERTTSRATSGCACPARARLFTPPRTRRPAAGRKKDVSVLLRLYVSVWCAGWSSVCDARMDASRRRSRSNTSTARSRATAACARCSTRSTAATPRPRGSASTTAAPGASRAQGRPTPRGSRATSMRPTHGRRGSFLHIPRVRLSTVGSYCVVKARLLRGQGNQSLFR